MRRSMVRWVRSLDSGWQRFRNREQRLVLIDCGLPMEFGMIAPIHRRLQKDPRIKLFFTSTVRPNHASRTFAEAGAGIRIISPARAVLMKFDAYFAADFVWANLPRGTNRIQTFHGVAGKYGNVYDRPERSLRAWDRLFFINQRRLNNFVASWECPKQIAWWMVRSSETQFSGRWAWILHVAPFCMLPLGRPIRH